MNPVPVAVCGHASTSAFLLLIGNAIADMGQGLKSVGIIAISLIIDDINGRGPEKGDGTHDDAQALRLLPSS